AHLREEHPIPAGAGNLPVGGVMVDAVGSANLIEEIELTCVDSFSELAECRFCGFFAHSSPLLYSCNSESQVCAEIASSVAGKSLVRRHCAFCSATSKKAADEAGKAR